MARVLIVEDDSQMREMLVELVGRAGHEVRSARDGKEALRVVRDQPVDLVVTDIVMPRKDGIRTIRELREKHRGTRVIAISGGDRKWAEDSYLGHAKFLGADGILAKPFGGSELVDMISEVLAQT